MKSCGKPKCGAIFAGVFQLALAFSLASSRAAPAPSEAATIPGYERVDLIRGSQNHLLLAATINAQPASLLLDTGVDVNLLEAARAGKFGLQPLGQFARVAGQSFPLAQTNALRAGAANLGSASFALYRASDIGGPIPGALSGSRADGIIGLDFLRRKHAIINCRTRHLFFNTDPSRRLDPGNIIRAGFVRVPIEADRRGYLTVPCTIRGRPGRLLLDTGAFLTGVDDDAAKSLALDVAPSRLTARGLDGKVQPVELAQINDLKIGGVAIEPQKFVVLDVFGRKRALRSFTGINHREYYAPLHIAPGDTVFGLLGNELLDQRRAIIDLGSMSVFLK